MITKNRFFNRELSWIEFNARVLSEAKKTYIPLLERLRFLTIVTTNFDEFFMVRVAELKRQSQTNPSWKDLSGLTPKQQLDKISGRVHEIINDQYECLNSVIIPQLAKEGISYVNSSAYTPDQLHYLSTLFQQEIFPLLTPLRVDSSTEFPHITNLRLHAAFLLKPLIEDSLLPEQFKHKKDEDPVAVVQLPSSIPRIVWLPSEGDKKKFALLDDIVTLFGTRLFPGYSVEESFLFKVTRDAAFAVDEERDIDFIQAMEEVLAKRLSSFPVRMICTTSSPRIQKFISDKLALTAQDVYEVKGIIDLATLADLISVEGFSQLKFPPWKHFQNTVLHKDANYWDVLKQRDILLTVPYESFEPVIDFVTRASEDPSVLAIKMTLYRTSGNSPIINSLEKAARNGKQVTVFVELKARFDEKQNISWASQLEQAGAIVVYGIANLKVHAKMLLIVRKEYDGIRRYVHLSTGNYNDKTARLYSDFSLFSSSEELGNDATQFFNMISGYSSVQTMKVLSMAPINLKSQLLFMIDREIQNSSKETPGLIMAKMNSLADKDIIEALYKASNAHVHILLNIRGICLIVPGIKGQSENISVVSIVDRYLEHARVFYFQNNGEEELYLGSADWMPRNLEKRVELMFPIIQEDIFKTLKETMLVYFSDNTNSYYLQSNGSWIQRKQEDQEEKLRAQEFLYNQFHHNYEAQIKELPKEFIVRRTEPK